jgi:hypothetical protein
MKEYGDYITRVMWWVQAKSAEPQEMGLLLAQQLTGPAFQAARNMDQGLLVTATMVEPGVTRLAPTGLPVAEESDTGAPCPSIGTPAKFSMPLGVYHLIRVLNESGFRLSSEDEAFACQVRFQDLRRRPDERMCDFIFKFDMLLAESLGHGVQLGNDSTLARTLLLKADVSAGDQRQVLALGGTSMSLVSIRNALRLLFAAEDDRRNVATQPVPTSQVLCASNDDSLIAVEMDVRFPGEEVFFTRKILLQRRDTGKPGLGAAPPRHHLRGPPKKAWEPGCWNCGDLTHFRSSCPHPLVPRPKVPVNQPGRYDVCSANIAVDHIPVWVSTIGAPFSDCGLGILDSACSANVAGSIWLKAYVAALPADAQHLVSSKPCSHSFAFGRDVRVASAHYTLPEWSNGIQRHVTVAVIEEQPCERRPIPLLLSRRWQQENGLVVDHRHDDVLVDCVRRAHQDSEFVVLSGRRVPLHIVKATGHHALQLLPTPTPTSPYVNATDEVLVTSTTAVPGARVSSIKKEVSRLHSVFGHPPTPRLVSVLRRAGVKDPAVLDAAEAVASTCVVCLSHGRPEPRPRACIPLSLNGEFNLWVALDLSMFETRWRLNIICLGTRFMRSRFISSKSCAAIVGALESEWTSFFGPMRNILTDVGGEFTGDEFRRYCEVNNIVLHTTAAEAQFANGVVERHGGLLSNVMARMRCDLPRVSPDLLLAKALLVHNDTATVDGTSPLQRLIGRRAHLPSVLVDGPSAISPTDGDLGPHLDHLSSLHAARIAFAQAQASASLKSALASRMWPSSRAVYNLDDKVYFYDAAGKSRTTGWRGPGTVTGFSPGAKMVTIQYGNQRYMRHVSKVRCYSDLHLSDHAGTPPHKHPSDVGALREVGGRPVDDAIEVCEPEPPERVQRPGYPAHIFHPEGGAPPTSDPDPQPDIVPAPPVVQDQEHAELLDAAHPDDSSDGDDDTPVPQLVPQPPAFLHPDIPLVRRSGRRGPPSLRLRESREGKDVAHLITTIPDASVNAVDEVFLSSREVPLSEQGPEFLEAKLREIADIRAYGAVESLDAAQLPLDAQIVDTRFICERRPGPLETTEAKARLVALGFQESVGTDAIDAPTVTRTGVRLLLAHAARRRWRTTCIDYKRAFLQARDRSPGDPVIAVVPPPEANEPPGFVWLLRKSLYGLRSAPKEWWLTLLASLQGLGFTQSLHDPAVFIFRDPTNAIIGLLALHVDDMLAAGSVEFDRVLERCESVHRIGSKLHSNFVYLGVAVATDPRGDITLCQSTFIEKIKLVDLPLPGKELSSNLLDALNHAVGELMWVAASTRCDIAVDAATLISELHHPTLATVLRTNKLVRYLHHTRTQPLHLSSEVSSGPLEFKVYADAALEPDSLNGKSRGGHLIALGPLGGLGQPELPLPFRMAVISWRSSLIQRVVTSSFSAELLNLCACLDAAIWTRDLFAEMTDEVLPIQAHMDCKSVVDCSKSLRLQATERRLTRYIWFLREALERVDVRPLLHIRSDQQVADGLTKRSPALRDALRAAMDGWGHRT